MALVDLVMPKMGESIMEATILKWNKKPGDPVKQDETVLEIATDKVDSEVPSTAAGTLQEILFKENDVVPIGSVIARIRTEAPEAARQDFRPRELQPSQGEKGPERHAAIDFSGEKGRPMSSGNGHRFYSPLVLNIASNEGVSLSELEKMPGTG
jgi:2-oxoglutarate dehydrogenase E2 component (dihydrolipoamide succinyltransferase)